MKAFRLIAAGVVAVGIFGAVIVANRLVTPGMNPLAPGGSVLGRWHGVAATPTGERMELWLELSDPWVNGCTKHCPQIEGRAVTCVRSGALGRYDVWGRVRSGQMILLSDPSGRGRPQLRIDGLTGPWPAQPWRLTTTLKVWRPVDGRSAEAGERSISGHPDSEAPTSWRLSRFNGAFPAQCPVD